MHLLLIDILRIFVREHYGKRYVVIIIYVLFLYKYHLWGTCSSFEVRSSQGVGWTAGRSFIFIPASYVYDIAGHLVLLHSIAAAYCTPRMHLKQQVYWSWYSRWYSVQHVHSTVEALYNRSSLSSIIFALYLEYTVSKINGWQRNWKILMGFRKVCLLIGGAIMKFVLLCRKPDSALISGITPLLRIDHSRPCASVTNVLAPEATVVEFVFCVKILLCLGMGSWVCGRRSRQVRNRANMEDEAKFRSSTRVDCPLGSRKATAALCHFPTSTFLWRLLASLSGARVMHWRALPAQSREWWPTNLPALVPPLMPQFVVLHLESSCTLLADEPRMATMDRFPAFTWLAAQHEPLLRCSLPNSENETLRARRLSARTQHHYGLAPFLQVAIFKVCQSKVVLFLVVGGGNTNKPWYDWPSYIRTQVLEKGFLGLCKRACTNFALHIF